MIMKRLLLFISAMFVWMGAFSQGTIPYTDDFESYTTGGFLAVQNTTWWTTWSNLPGGGEDGQISTDFARSGTKSVLADEVGGVTDQVWKLGNKTSGKYDLKWWMYIEGSKCGYYNIQHTMVMGQEFAFQVYFRTNGDINLYVGQSDTLIYPAAYPKDTWFEVRNLIDIDNDLITLIINGVYINQWPFHYTSFLTTGTNQLGGVDLFAGAAETSGESPKFYFDDASITNYTSTPTINVTPASLSSSIPSGLTEDKILTVANIGTANIDYTTSESLDWLSVAPAAGTSHPQENKPLTVTFNSIGLSAGTYTGTLSVLSNDPTTPQVDVPVSLTVEAVACAIPTLINPPSSITWNSASIGWVESGIAVRLQYVRVGKTDTISLAPSTTNPVLLTNLLPVTTYYVRVRQDCGAGSLSLWTSQTFTTLEQYSANVYPFSNGTGYVSRVTGTKKGPWMNVSTAVTDTNGRGFVKFDLSTLPQNAIISKVTLNYYNFYREATSAAANAINPLAFDPLTTNGGIVWGDCNDGGNVWAGAWGGTAPTWFAAVLNSNGTTYVNNQLSSGWAGFGLVRGAIELYRFSGANDATYKPYLQVEYHVEAAPVFSVTPASFNFEDVNLGMQSPPQVFRIKNMGSGSITVASLVLGGNTSEFILTDGVTPTTLGPGASYTVSVVFKPTSVGAKAATLTFLDGDENEYVANITGNGYLYGPQNLTAATVPGVFVNLAWQAPLPLTEIRYDNNSVTNFLWFAQPPASTTLQQMFTRITIPANGTLTNIAMFTRALSASTWGSISLCPDNGGAPNLAAPIESFLNVPVTAVNGEWVLKTLTTPLAVTAGQTYYIVAQWPNGNLNGPLIAYDGASNHLRCWYTSTGGALWTNWAGNFLMRAYMNVGADKSTGEPVVLASGPEVEGMQNLPVVSINDGSPAPSGMETGIVAPAVTAPSNQNKSFTSYTVHRGLVSGTWTDNFTGVSGTTYQDVTAAASTYYYYMVSAEYSNGSANSNITGIKTCENLTPPYAENFDTYTIPATGCVAVTNDNGDAYQWKTTTSWSRSTPNGIYMRYNSTLAMDDWFFTPGLNLVAGKSYDVKFWYLGSGSYPEKMEVLWGTAQIADGMTEGLIFNNDNIVNTSFVEGSGTIEVATTGVYYIGWHGYSDMDQYYLVVDDITVTVVPTCLMPTVLAPTAVTTSTATISWTAPTPEPANGYDYEVRTYGGGGSGASGLIVAGSTLTGVLTANITGLVPGSNYKVYVRGNCGAETSNWAGPQLINTLCPATFSVPYAESFDTYTPPALGCGTVTNNNADAYLWMTSTLFPRTAPNSMYIRYNSAMAMDDWFFTPGINLEAGKYYRVKFWYVADGVYPEKMEVKWGTAPNAAGMTGGQIFDDPEILNDVYVEGTGLISVATTGVYYVGWHGYSDPDEDVILVDDITITEIVPEENVTVTGDVTTLGGCYNATNTVTLGGTPAFTITATGGAEVRAGVRILIVPDAHVFNQGYLWAHITPGGPWCPPPAKIAQVTAAPEEQLPTLEKSWFTIFPNPTNGNITLVQKGDMQYGDVRVEVFSMRGDRVLSSQMIGVKQHEFETSALPTGIYFVKVIAEGYVETIKLVKTR